MSDRMLNGKEHNLTIQNDRSHTERDFCGDLRDVQR